MTPRGGIFSPDFTPASLHVPTPLSIVYEEVDDGDTEMEKERSRELLCLSGESGDTGNDSELAALFCNKGFAPVDEKRESARSCNPTAQECLRKVCESSCHVQSFPYYVGGKMRGTYLFYTNESFGDAGVFFDEPGQVGYRQYSCLLSRADATTVMLVSADGKKRLHRKFFTRDDGKECLTSFSVAFDHARGRSGKRSERSFEGRGDRQGARRRL